MPGFHSVGAEQEGRVEDTANGQGPRRQVTWLSEVTRCCTVWPSAVISWM